MDQPVLMQAKLVLLTGIAGHNQWWIDTDSIDQYYWSHFSSILWSIKDLILLSTVLIIDHEKLVWQMTVDPSYTLDPSVKPTVCITGLQHATALARYFLIILWRNWKQFFWFSPLDYERYMHNLQKKNFFFCIFGLLKVLYSMTKNKVD